MRGEPTREAFDALLEQPSQEAARSGVVSASEGVVLRSDPLLRNVFGEWLIIKHKNERFAEVARAAPGARPVDRTSVEAFVRTYVLAGRVTNVVGHLREAGTAITNGMEDVRVLVPAVLADLRKECAPELAELLAAGFSDGDVKAGVTRTLATVYRRMLEDAVS